MAFGDVGGAVTQLIITCKTPETGSVDIAQGDPLRLIGNYAVAPAARHDRIFGQAMADCQSNGAAIQVKVRGICRFPYGEYPPEIDRSVQGGGGGIVIPGRGINTVIAIYPDKLRADVLL